MNLVVRFDIYLYIPPFVTFTIRSSVCVSLVCSKTIINRPIKIGHKQIGTGNKYTLHLEDGSTMNSGIKSELSLSYI